jgi:hypothetical protein
MGAQRSVIVVDCVFLDSSGVEKVLNRGFDFAGVQSVNVNPNPGKFSGVIGGDIGNVDSASVFGGCLLFWVSGYTPKPRRDCSGRGGGLGRIRRD